MALLDIIPLVIFFVSYKFGDIYIATAALIAASVIHIGGFYWLKGTVSKQQLFILVICVIFGGLTLVLEDKRYIMYKPTLLYGLFAMGIVVSHWLNKSAIKAVLSSLIEMPENLWWRVTWLWSGFYAVAAVLNIYVANTMSEAAWVNFKVFGIIGASMLLIILTLVSLRNYIINEEE